MNNVHSVIEKIYEIDTLINFHSVQKRTLKKIHEQLESMLMLMNRMKWASYNQKHSGHNQLVQDLINMSKLGQNACPVNSIDNVNEMEKITLAGEVGQTGPRFGGAQYGDLWGLTGEAGDHIRRDLQCWNNLNDIVPGNNYVRVIANEKQITLGTHENFTDTDGTVYQNLTAYSLVNKYLPRLNECIGCISYKAINKFRLRNFDFVMGTTGGTGAVPGAETEYEPNPLYFIQAKLIGVEEYPDVVEFLTDGTYNDFVCKWNDTFMGCAAPARYVSATDNPYVEICVHSGADLVFGLSPGDENQWVSVEIVPEVDGEIRNPVLPNNNSETGDCLLLSTEGLGWVDTLEDCVSGNDTEIAVRGRATVVISGYVSLYSPLPFRVESNNNQITENIGTLFPFTISRNFPYLINWCYIKSIRELLKVKVPFKCTAEVLTVHALVLPLKILARYLQDKHLCELTSDNIEDIMESMINLFEIMVVHSQALDTNLERAHRVRCEYICYANSCILDEKDAILDNVYGEDKCVNLNKRIYRMADKQKECKYRCGVPRKREKNKN